MTQKISGIELLPEFLVGIFRYGIQQQRGNGFFLSCALAVLSFAALAAQQASRAVKKVLEQPCLPGIPDLGAGAAHIGDRQ